MTPANEAECRRVVLGYANAKNEWDILKYIFDRVQEGRHESTSRAALVAGLSEQDFKTKHVSKFASYIYPKDRKYGTNPGGPTMISRDGPFARVDAATISSVTERNRNTIEVVTEWAYHEFGHDHPVFADDFM